MTTYPQQTPAALSPSLAPFPNMMARGFPSHIIAGSLEPTACRRSGRRLPCIGAIDPFHRRYGDSDGRSNSHGLMETRR